VPALTISLVTLAITGPILWLLRPHRSRLFAWLAALPPLAVTVWLLFQSIPISQGAVIAESYAWAPAYGLELSLRLDGLGLLFGLVIAGIGTGIALYTGYYFDDDSSQGFFYFLLFLFMSSMLGVVWTDNLLALFVFWEGTSITSYLLIGFRTDDKKAMAGARTAFVVTGLGALAMLGGFVILGISAGTYTISELVTMPDLMADPIIPVALVLVLLGAFTKSAQFPFQFWLPGAMAAPTPASAYLHSATMVKAGVYLLARLHPAFAGNDLWFWSLFIVGGITMLLGAISALRYYDLKALLAYATVSQLGILVMLLAFDSEYAYVAVAIGILAHALYKGPLFMMAGIIDHATGTRDIRRLAALWRPLPWVAAVGFIAGLSMAGIPPFFGFLAKETLLETFYEFGLSEGMAGWIGFIMAAVTGAFFVGYSFTLMWETFLRKRPAEEPAATVHHAPPFAFVLPPLALALTGVIAVIFLGPLSEYIIGPAAGAISGVTLEVHLALWHGFTPILITSLIAISAGVVIFLLRNSVRAAFTHAPARMTSSYAFDQIDKGSYAVADWSTSKVQGGTLATQASIVMLAGVIVLFFAIFRMGLGNEIWSRWDIRDVDIRLYEALTVILIIFAAITTTRARSRLTGIISIGVVGIAVTLFFVLYSAPDLALTQLLVEVLTVVLLILIFYRIPEEDRPVLPRNAHIRNVAVAALAGIFGFTLTLVALPGAYTPVISDYFLLNSVAGGHGGNVVNVILVDFRGYDTMGEITVLVIAALGGYALLRAPRFRPLHTEPSQTLTIADETTVEEAAVVISPGAIDKDHAERERDA